jgi:maleate isomerase
MGAACAEALALLGVERIALVTPYVHEVHARVAAFLAEHGRTVAAGANLGMRSNLAINRLHPDTARRAVLDVLAAHAGADVDGVLISCGGWRTFEVLAPLERELGVPVVSSNSAGLWKALRLAGIDDPVPGLGRLLAGRAHQENGTPATRSTANG